MPFPPSLARDPAVAGPIGSLAFSAARPGAPTLALRAARWHANLERMGVRLPFVVVHDIGLALAADRDQVVFGPRLAPEAAAGGLPGGAEMLRSYATLVEEIGAGEASRRARELGFSDDLVAVVLAKLLGPIAARIEGRPAYEASVPLDAAVFDQIDSQLPDLARAMPRTWELGAIGAVAAARLFLLAVADALDVDTLRLLGMLGRDTEAGALELADLLAALCLPEANDVVNFSLELLPSVLETRARPAVGEVPEHGYAGVGRRGSIDSMVWSELAWDDDELGRRLVENEVLYWAREQGTRRGERVHHLVVDASASMRGDRQIFARAVALASAKKILLRGDEVVLRFFDSRLYPPHRARGGQIPTAYVLCFRGEHGRNPTRVFAALAAELELARAHDGRDVVVHVLTHAALYVPRPVVERLRRVARVAGVFLLPSAGKLDLEWADLLDAVWVVDHRTLAERGARAERARNIVDGVAQGGRA